MRTLSLNRIMGYSDYLFDRRLKLACSTPSRLPANKGLLAYRELDGALGLISLKRPASSQIAARARNGWHGIVSIIRQLQSMGSLAGYLRMSTTPTGSGVDRAMRSIVGDQGGRAWRGIDQRDRAVRDRAAGEQREPRGPCGPAERTWFDRVHDHDPPRRVVLDMDSSVSPTFGCAGGQERDPVDTPVVPQVRPQCRSPPASRARLQSRQLHAHPRAARCRGTVVTDQPAREAHQDRSEDRAPRALRHVPDGRGCHSS